MKELDIMGKKPRTTPKTRATLAACAVASTVAATAAYRRRSDRRRTGNNTADPDFATSRPGAGPEAHHGETQPL